MCKTTLNILEMELKFKVDGFLCHASDFPHSGPYSHTKNLRDPTMDTESRSSDPHKYVAFIWAAAMGARSSQDAKVISFNFASATNSSPRIFVVGGTIFKIATSRSE